MEITTNEIMQFVLHLEQKYNLLDYKIKNVYFWKIIRFRVFTSIIHGAGVLEDAHPDANRKETLIKKVNHLLFLELKSMKYNALKKNYIKDVMIFHNPRKTLVDGDKTSIYTDILSEELKNKHNYHLEELELTFIDNKYHDNKHRKIARGSILSKVVYTLFSNQSLDDKDQQLLTKINKDIYKMYALDIDVVGITKKSLRNFQTNYNYFDKLLKKRKPRDIYIVCSYGREPLIAAARKYNVKVIEVQHGVMSKNSPGYSFPNSETVPYFPDKILLYGQYWDDSTSLPLPKDNIIYYGYPYLKNRVNKYKDIKKLKNSIIFLSQGSISKKLSEIAYDFSRDNTQYKVYYKLHPSEYNTWHDNYDYLVEANKLDNFNVITGDRNLYDIFAETEYQVGVSSMAIYEGIAMGVKTILVNLPSVENMGLLVENKLVPMVENALNIKSELGKYEINKIDRTYFFNDLK